ncbi:hypothetical protein AXK57_18875 [Tsukamurella pulmonis]|uniref:hypothetical protein n=1 Tax=Tsukamurella pulmonis TaxID=47312 RepID=UPI0007934111|nr:hypothetical protein [Tsukamurella pulmonis]KXP12367.1 hypothetical protein AXK57_18875 [Tsukamurella pulmonis]
MSVGVVIVVAVAVVAVLVLAGVVWFLRDSNKRIKDFANSTDLIPGRPGRAPAEWATATSTEALLHQRTRYAIADVHRGAFAPAVPPPADSAINGPESDLADLDDAVFELDDAIIAAAQLTGEERTKALGEIDPKVAALEGLTGKLWDAPSAQRRPLIDGVAATLRR